ncbi:hypothetical protein [Actinomyces howellii]|uniref:Uncharacterized protein n=1 Tax=Actinomyces howellii TaxID=52771 RepID=A0A3S4TA51_9ACTO|nr:hypothetical protein [Actinomyces howellii]VEG28523.1 Uncharacterised protein [Actinomyces howellii]
MTVASGSGRAEIHRAQINMTVEMFRGLRILAAEQDTTVTALVLAAIEQAYPELRDSEGIR